MKVFKKKIKDLIMLNKAENKCMDFIATWIGKYLLVYLQKIVLIGELAIRLLCALFHSFLCSRVK